jgi:hypothetical protein
MCRPFNESRIDWHDLPISKLSFIEIGVVIDVHPYNESTKEYDHAIVSILEPHKLKVDIQGNITLKELAGLEITTFTCENESGERKSGVIEIIPNTPSAGYWKISFTNAHLKLEWPNHSLKATPQRRTKTKNA